MAEKNYITPDGYKRLVDELTELATVERPRVVREVSDAAAEADITHIDMGNEPASEATALRLLLSVRDRLHLADVMRTLKRSPAVLRVARVKP
jgi:(p)ppGpp synthase/HD superfamily hydrolase